MLAASAAQVAVVIAAKDAQATIGRAVISALAQPEAAQILVVDDGSTDGTAAMAASCDDGSGRLEIIRLTRNQGPAGARNAALDRVRAAHFCVLDADDSFQPGRLARLLSIAADGWDMVADDLLIESEGAMRPLLAFTPAKTPANAAPHRLDLRAFVRGNISHPSRPRQELGFLKPLIRKACMTGRAIRYRPELRLGEDYALYAELLAHGARACLVGPCGYVATRSAGGLSSRHTKEDLLALADADLDILRIPGLATTERRALRQHRRSVLLKYHHRAMLDAKKSGRLREAFAELLKTPSVTAYILRETVRARTGQLRARAAA